ncbi:HD domain-containing protein [Methylobacterium sp. WL120]|uniref:HD domain-containing protein n=1 Tax=Methylobacterium sp. WL120 TaxID=2603887 RepID=UPI0011CB76D9|nr:HD domain-containing protein [Methylobacterium sp. WL120]TXM69638.1 bifunctional (p)ppGpp synthetase/guanosine-3',5'-bis(diphosphate) 3'-pyrophosphohydrolase [Methylobacterium sp. WL120]
MTIIEKALVFATEAHKGQMRKYTADEYIIHPIAVSERLRDLGFADEILAAALLHDTVEDTSVTSDDIRREFGDRVADLVAQVTDVSIGQIGNRAHRKALDRDHLALADADGQSIKMADLIDNAESITTHDPSFAKVYMAEKADLWELLRLAAPALRQKALEVLNAYQRERLPKF